MDAAASTDHDSTPYVLYKADGNNIGNLDPVAIW
jgi:hypothetical protein